MNTNGKLALIRAATPEQVLRQSAKDWLAAHLAAVPYDCLPHTYLTRVDGLRTAGGNFDYVEDVGDTMVCITRHVASEGT